MACRVLALVLALALTGCVAVTIVGADCDHEEWIKLGEVLRLGVNANCEANTVVPRSEVRMDALTKGDSTPEE